MRLANSEHALAPTAKMEGYLLSEIHPVGRPKALFLKNLGYDNTDAEILARDLLLIPREEDVSDIQASEYGTKYIIDGMMQTPSGSIVAMRTVWIIESDNAQPKFVTAYPARFRAVGE